MKCVIKSNVYQTVVGITQYHIEIKGQCVENSGIGQLVLLGYWKDRYALQATSQRNLVLSGGTHLDSIDSTGPALKKRGGPGGLAWGERGKGKGVTRRKAGFFYREVIITAVYLYIFICLYRYILIFVYVYISNYYLSAMSIEQTPSDLFNPFGAALRTIFRYP